MFKKEILKGAASRNVKHLDFRNERGISKSDFKNKNDGEVEESVPQVPVAGKITEPPK